MLVHHLLLLFKSSDIVLVYTSMAAQKWVGMYVWVIEIDYNMCCVHDMLTTAYIEHPQEPDGHYNKQKMYFNLKCNM